MWRLVACASSSPLATQRLLIPASVSHASIDCARTTRPARRCLSWRRTAEAGCAWGKRTARTGTTGTMGVVMHHTQSATHTTGSRISHPQWSVCYFVAPLDLPPALARSRRTGGSVTGIRGWQTRLAVCGHFMWCPQTTKRAWLLLKRLRCFADGARIPEESLWHMLLHLDRYLFRGCRKRPHESVRTAAHSRQRTGWH